MEVIGLVFVALVLWSVLGAIADWVEDNQWVWYVVPAAALGLFLLWRFA